MSRGLPAIVGQWPQQRVDQIGTFTANDVAIAIGSLRFHQSRSRGVTDQTVEDHQIPERVHRSNELRCGAIVGISGDDRIGDRQRFTITIVGKNINAAAWSSGGCISGDRRIFDSNRGVIDRNSTATAIRCVATDGAVANGQFSGDQSDSTGQRGGRVTRDRAVRNFDRTTVAINATTKTTFGTGSGAVGHVAADRALRDGGCAGLIRDTTTGTVGVTSQQNDVVANRTPVQIHRAIETEDTTAIDSANVATDIAVGQRNLYWEFTAGSDKLRDPTTKKD